MGLSSIYVYTLAKGVNRGHLGPEFVAPALRGYAGLVRDKVVRDDQGRWSLTGIVRSAGLGPPPDEWPPGIPTPSRRDTIPGGRDGSFEYYVEQPVTVDNLHGLGPLILAGVEVEQLPLVTDSAAFGDQAARPAPGCRFSRP